MSFNARAAEAARSGPSVSALRAVMAFIKVSPHGGASMAASSPIVRWLAELAVQPVKSQLWESPLRCGPLPNVFVKDAGQRGVRRVVDLTYVLHPQKAVSWLSASEWWYRRAPEMGLEVNASLTVLEQLPRDVTRRLATHVRALTVLHPIAADSPPLLLDFTVHLDSGIPQKRQPKAKPKAPKPTPEQQQREEAARLEALLTVLQQFPRLDALSLKWTPTSQTLHLCRLAPLRNLRKLNLNGFRGPVDLTGVAEALPELQELTVAYTPVVDSVAALATCAKLRVLDISHTYVSDLSPLARCPALETLVCHELVSPTQFVAAHLYGGRVPRSKQESCRMTPLRVPVNLSVLSGAPALREIDTRGCHIVSLAGLAACPVLEKLNFHGCVNNLDLDGLQGSPSLKELQLRNTAVQALGPLVGCRALETLDVRECRFLAQLDGIHGLPHLQSLNASGSALRTVGPLHTCTGLVDVQLDQTHSLEDVSGLGGAPSLKTLNLTNSDVSVLGDFSACHALEEVHVAYCRKLTSLAAFAGAPSLRQLDAKQSGVTALTGLGRCPALYYLDVQDSTALVSLHGLEGAPQLQLLHIGGTSVDSLEPLRGLPALEQLNASSCPRLTSVEPLRRAPCLESIALRHTTVADLDVLDTCPRLNEVFVSPPQVAEAKSRRTEGRAQRASKGNCTAF